MTQTQEITPYIDQQAITQLIENMNMELGFVQAAVKDMTLTDETLNTMSDKDLKDSKTWLSTAIRDAKAAKTKFRKEWQQPMNKVGELFDAELETANELLARYKAEFDKRDQQRREERTAQLEAVYVEFCEASGLATLPQNVPFGRIFEKEWLNGGKAWSIKKVAPKVEEKAGRIISDYNLLGAMAWWDEDAARRDFFNTLNLSECSRLSRKRKAEQDALDALKAEQAANEAYMQEQAAQEQAEQQTQPAPAESEPVQPTPAEQPAQPAEPQPDTQAAHAPVYAFTLTLQATDAQFGCLLEYMRGARIKGSFKKNVTVSV